MKKLRKIISLTVTVVLIVSMVSVFTTTSFATVAPSSFTSSNYYVDKSVSSTVDVAAATVANYYVTKAEFTCNGVTKVTFDGIVGPGNYPQTTAFNVSSWAVGDYTCTYHVHSANYYGVIEIASDDDYAYATIHVSCSHATKKYVDTVNPTCTDDGYTSYHCPSCGKDFEEDIKPAPGHFSVEDATIPATCTTEGYSAGSHCGVCGITLTERTKVSDALGHNWNGGVITVSPTCAFPGEKLFTCQRCKTTKTETVQKLGHNWDGGIVTSDPTCTQQGVRTFTCSRCNGKETEQINALGHSYRHIVISPTCTAKGYTKHECTRCAGFYCDTVTNPTGHSTLTGYTEVVPASCEGIGVEAQFCTKCGGVMALREKAATGHSEEIIPAVPATTQSEGLTQGVKCSICEKILVEQEIVPKIRPQQGETNQGSDTQASLGETEQKEQDTVFDILGVIKWIYENVISKIFSLFITGIQG